MKVEYSVEKPLNREPAIKDLISSYITPNNDTCYDRNHGPIPYLNAKDHVVKVDGEVLKPLQLSVEDLKTRFKQHEIVSALQCAGNRRHIMRTLLKEVNGLDWFEGAVMNCRWRGPKLRDVLNEAGINVKSIKDYHVAFACYKVPVQGGESWYGGSIELARAMKESADVLVALEMNGQPLPVRHGYPIRIIVPGVSGCRSVKWLDRITVQSEESTNLYQRYDYKILPPSATNKETASKYWDKTPALQDMPINSVIAVPQNGDKVKLATSGTVEVKGYALPQGDQGPVVKVEVSADDGRTWKVASILPQNNGQSKWAWALWKATVQLQKGQKTRLLSRATDKGGNMQSGKPQWNLRGVAYDGYGISTFDVAA